MTRNAMIDTCAKIRRATRAEGTSRPPTQGCVNRRRVKSVLLRRLVILALLAPLAAGSPGRAGSEPHKAKPLFEQVTDKAREMAQDSYEPVEDLPEGLEDLNYRRYRDIRFDKQKALWKGDALFNVELFHLGFLYDVPVTIHQVVDGKAEQVVYDPQWFDFGDNAGLRDQIGPGLGFAGFRIHFPIHRGDYYDEVIAFLGASYFRMVGAGQSYGLSARGLAVNTAVNEGEEFPRFTEFWLVRPDPGDTKMTFYALLDSESVTGAYRFDLDPGDNTVLDVEARLFARRDIEKLGVAPLTSMFLYGENAVRYHDDYRPEIHDSDGLLMHTGEDEWVWRPLTNDGGLRVSALADRDPEGFGLVQRDRDFDHYLDTESRYQNRPSYWIVPRGDWGPGSVELVEIPSKEEGHDNIVAFWVPDESFDAGEARAYEYRLHTFGGELDAEPLATARRTRIGWAGPGSEDRPPRKVRQFIVDFRGGELGNLDDSQPVKADLSTTSGEIRHITVDRLPAGRGWRVAFKLAPEGEAVADMRMFLTLRGERLSETWNYVWNPKLIK